MSEENARSTEKTWLIKSSTRILGPFSLDELTQHLRSKHISIIDEIRHTSGRWGYIRENPMFMDIVRNIREEPDVHSEKTMTQSIAHHTMTKTDAINIDEDTLTPTPPDSDLTPPPLRRRARDLDLKDVTPKNELPPTRTSGVTQTRSYGSSKDTRLQERNRRRSDFIRWALLGLAAVIAVGVVVGVTQKDKKKSDGYDELMAQALRFKNIGLYDKSLQAYLKASKIKEPDADSQNQMAIVLISEDRQTLVGRRILERTFGVEGRNRGENVSAYLGIAVSYMMDGDLKQADDTLQKASVLEPFNISTLLNMAIIQLKKGSYADAMNSFENIYRKNPNSVMALYGRALATLEYTRNHNNPNALNLLIEDIKFMVQRTGYLRQELLLFKIYAHHLLGDVDGVNQSTVQFLNQLPEESRRYSHPIEVDWRITQWDYLEKYCSEIYNKYSTNPEVKAMRGICLIQVNRDADAAKYLQEALAEAPKDPYVLAAQAIHLEKLSRLPEAQAVLKSPELGSLAIKNSILGKICMSTNDITCVQNAFNEVYRVDRNSALASYGLAWASKAQKDRAQAYNYVRAGLQAEPNYTPLLEMRNELESE